MPRIVSHVCNSNLFQQPEFLFIANLEDLGHKKLFPCVELDTTNDLINMTLDEKTILYLLTLFKSSLINLE
jgi:hypothetical protein